MCSFVKLANSPLLPDKAAEDEHIPEFLFSKSQKNSGDVVGAQGTPHAPSTCSSDEAASSAAGCARLETFEERAESPDFER